MKKNLGIIIWGLLLALTLFLTLVIPTQYTSQIWTVVIFDVIAFVTQLFIWFSKVKNDKEKFYKYPAMTLSTTYLVIQFILSIVVALVNEAIAFKIVLIINFVLLVIMLVLVLLTVLAKDKIENLDSRQKNRYTKL
jgi:hypothetical protein